VPPSPITEAPPAPPAPATGPAVKVGYPAARRFDPLKHGGTIQWGSIDTLIEKRAAARFTDATTCPIKGPGMLMETSTTVFINGLGAARKNDQAQCGTSSTWIELEILGLHVDVWQRERSVTSGDSLRILRIRDDVDSPSRDITVGLFRGVRDPAGFGSLTAALFARMNEDGSEVDYFGLSLNIDMLAGDDGYRTGMSLVINPAVYVANVASPTLNVESTTPFMPDQRANAGFTRGIGFGGGLGAFYNRADGRFHVTGQIALPTGPWAMFDWSWEAGEPEGAAGDPAADTIQAGASTVFIGP
jgi:uncharacterized Zn-binding protein involved in type VI secretion